MFDAEFAAGVQRLRQPAAPALPQATGASAPALRLTAMLQREGRLVDFCEEDLAGYSDAQVGAAARTVHEGCRKALREAFLLQPVRPEPEGAPVELPAGFDSRAVRLTGNVQGNPPFRGVLKHHGWKVAEVRMPAASTDPTIIAPAEVELP